MTISATGSGPKITATGEGTSVLVEILTGSIVDRSVVEDVVEGWFGANPPSGDGGVSPLLGEPLMVPEDGAEHVLTATDGLLDDRWVITTPDSGGTPFIVLPDPRTLDEGQEIQFSALPGASSAAIAYWYKTEPALIPFAVPGTFEFAASPVTVTYTVTGVAEPIVVELDADYGTDESPDYSAYATALLAPLAATGLVELVPNTANLVAVSIDTVIERTVSPETGGLTTETFSGGEVTVDPGGGLVSNGGPPELYLWEPAEPSMGTLHHGRLICGADGWFPIDVKPNTANQVLWHLETDNNGEDPLAAEGWRTFARSTVEEGLIGHELLTRRNAGMVIDVVDDDYAVTTVEVPDRNLDELVEVVGNITLNVSALTAPRVVTLPDIDARIGGSVTVITDGSCDGTNTVTVGSFDPITSETITVYDHGPEWRPRPTPVGGDGSEVVFVSAAIDDPDDDLDLGTVADVLDPGPYLILGRSVAAENGVYDAGVLLASQPVLVHAGAYYAAGGDVEIPGTWLFVDYTPDSDPTWQAVGGSTSVPDTVDGSEVWSTAGWIATPGGGGGGGSGDVVGPSSAVDGRAVLFDGTTGKLIKQASAAPVLEGDSRLTDARVPLWRRLTFSNTDYNLGSAPSPAVAGSVVLMQTGTLSAARTVTLPAASSVPAGGEVIINAGAGCSATNTLTIARAGSDTINGASTSLVIATAYGQRRLVSDGSAAWVHDDGLVRRSANLSDLADAATARTNLKTPQSSDDTVLDIRVVTQAAYNALTPVSTTLYFISG